MSHLVSVSAPVPSAFAYKGLQPPKPNPLRPTIQIETPEVSQTISTGKSLVSPAAQGLLNKPTIAVSSPIQPLPQDIFAPTQPTRPLFSGSVLSSASHSSSQSARSKDLTPADVSDLPDDFKGEILELIAGNSPSKMLLMKLAPKTCNPVVIEKLLPTEPTYNRSLYGNNLVTTLHTVAGAGHAPVVQKTIELIQAHHESLDPQDREGQTPLYWAVRSNKAESVKILLNAGADKTKADKQGITPETLARASDNPDIRKAFGFASQKTKKKKPKMQKNKTKKMETASPPSTPLPSGRLTPSFKPASSGTITPTPPVEATTTPAKPKPISPLRRVRSEGHLSALKKQRAQQAASQQSQGTQTEPPIARTFKDAAISVMPPYRSKKTQTEAPKPVVYKSKIVQTDKPKATILQSQGAQTDSQNSISTMTQTPLSKDHGTQTNTPTYASVETQTKPRSLLRSFLAQWKIPVNAQDVDGRTPLMHAAMDGDLATTRQLVRKGANIALEDHSGKTALDWAKENGHAEIVNYLNWQDFPTLTPQDLAYREIKTPKPYWLPRGEGISSSRPNKQDYEVSALSDYERSGDKTTRTLFPHPSRKKKVLRDESFMEQD